MPWSVRTTPPARDVDSVSSCMRLAADAENGVFARPDPENGPGSSSYELKAITEEMGHPDADPDEPWDHDVEAVALNGENHRPLSLTHNPAKASTASWEATAESVPLLERTVNRSVVFPCAPGLGDHVPCLGRAHCRAQRVVPVRPWKRTTRQPGSDLQRGLGPASRPRGRVPVLAG